MEMKLTPMTAQETVFEGDGGAYYSWSPSEMPLLTQYMLGAGKFVLQPGGFALPHYSDSSKIGYVLQGDKGLAGMVFPDNKKPKEEVVELKKGDVIPVPSGVVSWWYNGGDSVLEILFLGETTKAPVPGQFTYFFLTGTLGILGGFSPDFITKYFHLNNDDEAYKLTKSQKGSLIIKLEEENKNMPKPNNLKLIHNIDHDAKPKVGFTKITSLTETCFPFLKQVGLSANLEKLDADDFSFPVYRADSTVEVVYVVKGGGKVQIVGSDGKCLLDVEVKEGQLFVVPRYFVIAKIAGSRGLECFSMITSTQPLLQELAGRASVWEALSPNILQTSLNVTAEFAEMFRSNARKS